MDSSNKAIINLTEWQSDDGAENQTPKKSPTENSESVLDTLRSIQEDNPQIETIFIDSDEDEEDLVKKPRIQIHDMLTLSSTKEQPAPKPVALSSTKEQPAPKPAAPRAFQSSNVINKSPFNVREISPASLTSNIVKGSNTIVLQDESKGISSRSYLVIPKEVFPLLARSKGPVALNVPGIGPLLIPKPAEMLKHSTPSENKNLPFSNTNIPLNHSAANKHQQIPVQGLNSINLSQVSTQNNSNVNKQIPVYKPSQPVEPKVYHRVYDPLTDHKYCWRFRKGIKRDLDGFSLNDRLGFYKAERHRSSLCEGKCIDAAKKVEYSLNMLKRKLAAVQGSKLNMNKIKVVEVDTIKNKKSKAPRNTQKIAGKINSKELTTLQKKNLKTLLSWKERFEQPTDFSSGTDDLLVTKKVVVVNENNLETKKRGRRKKKLRQAVKKEKDHTYSMPGECDINATTLHQPKRQKISQERSSEKRTSRGKLPKKYDSSTESIISTEPESEPKKARTQKDVNPKTTLVPPIPKKKGRPRKIKRVRNWLRKKTDQVEPITSLKVEPIDLIFEEPSEGYHQKKPKKYTVIDSIKRLQKGVDSLKPILVVNEEQCAKLDLVELSSKNNLIFPTSEIVGLSTSFVTAAKESNIKFVRPDILCQYLSGVRE